MYSCAVLAVLAVAAVGGARAGCGLAQFACRSGGCVRADAYCDGAAACTDGSDEPPGCSVCNRTYYGRAGAGYELALRPAQAAHVPFLCHLTFTAGGAAHGDLVQLAFSEFRVGRYEATALDGCPDGYMQVSELGRPFTGGSWCGAADGAALYYSETSTVTVSIKLFRARLGEPFGLRLRYKFLAQRDAIVRFGAASSPLERGAVSPGTYCTRTYEECHRKPCRLQSPNYPGMYPRNVTCYWSLRQKDIPTCKHAMISVRQEYAHKMQIKRSISMASLNKTGRAVRAWGECTGERDRLIVYDGGSTDDPVLLEYCGGDWLPRVTARGPDMLVAFHSSPFSAPLPSARTYYPLRGFELDVDVIFADSDSLDYAREARRCEFHVKASSSSDEGNATTTRGRRGRIHAPTHTLPPNTTCTWTFHGRPGDLVWIYFSSFTQYSLVESRRDTSGEREEGGTAAPSVVAGAGTQGAQGEGGPCAVELRIWDGGGAGEARQVGRYCDTAPALCARASLANATRAPRPCAPPDGYVSTGPQMSLAVTSRWGTATHPLSFTLQYEFVDARQPGAALHVPAARPPACAREITTPGEVLSPRNVLWFGRGGGRHLRCVYRLRAPGRRLQLALSAATLGTEPRCATRTDPRTTRLVCVPDDSDPNEELLVPHLLLYEAPWEGVRVPLGCVCDNSSVPLSARAHSALELELVAPALSPREDQRDLQYRAAWTSAAEPPCAARRRPHPPGAHHHLTYPYENDVESECGETPYLLTARGNRSVFLRVWGEELPSAPPPAAPPAPSAPPLCHTTNRILVYDPYTHKLLKAICPREGGGVVQMFTAEWWGANGARVASGGGDTSGGGAALLVVWAAREAGTAKFAWMEVWRAGPAGGAGVSPDDRGGVNATAGCRHACAALAACMAGALWCDGAADCPGGADEAAGGACGAGARLLGALGALGAGGAWGAAAGAAGAVLAAGALAARARARRRGKRAPGALAAGRRLTEELLYDDRSPGS